MLPELVSANFVDVVLPDQGGSMSSTEYVESAVEVDELARRLFTVLLNRGIGFGFSKFDELDAAKQEVYRNDARIILLMQATGRTEA